MKKTHNIKMVTRSRFRRAIQRWRLCYAFAKLTSEPSADARLEVCTRHAQVVFPHLKSSNVSRAIRSYGHYLNHAHFYMSLDLYRTYVALERHVTTNGQSEPIGRHLGEVVEMLKALQVDRQSEHDRRKQYILDNIGLTDLQARIVQMILHDTTLLTDHHAVWTCIERSVEFMLEQIQREQQQRTFDTFFRFMYRIRCALLDQCAHHPKRRQHVQAVLSFDRVEQIILTNPDALLDEALVLILGAATYVISDVSTLQACLDSSKSERYAMFIVECHYKFDIALF